MRALISWGLLVLAGCGCAALRDGRDHFTEAMMVKRSQPERFRAEMEQAINEYERALSECHLDELERTQTLSMITRCLMELDRFAEAERVIQDMGETIDKHFGKVDLSGDRLAIDFFMAQYWQMVGRRALQGINEASTDRYSEMKLHLALPNYEQALHLYRTYETSDDAEIGRYAVLRDCQATLELARGYTMPRTPAANQNFPKARELLAGALEKVKQHAGPPLQAEFDSLRPQLVKDLDWVDAQLKK
jgi:tetratricopeptide (TPR) repeat protein